MRILGSLRGKVVTLVVTISMALMGSTVAQTSSAQAYSGADFNPGNIISDAVFFNGSSMSGPEIQAFLNSRVPRCTLGDPGRPAGGIYTFSNGSQTLLAHDCLKDYVEWIPDLSGDSICEPITGGTYSAADLIHRVGAACKVSQKVLLVLLEKEQSLISDSFPAQSQMDRATGFNCPDTAPCNTASAGFFRQVYSAARQLQVYGTGSFTWYPVGQVTSVRYHPNAYCGSQAVLIQNRATAALYYYTPYQPNNAALSNLYGTGDSCSAYGNRNFWRMYNDWFGSTQLIDGSTEFVRAIYQDVLGRSAADSEVNSWAAAMAGGESRTGVALGFVNSDEYYKMKIIEAYTLALNRQPDAQGLSNWLTALRGHQYSPEELYSLFLGTSEMFDIQGGGTNAGYINALYQELLGRAPDSEGFTRWDALLTGGSERQIISNAIWYSPEKYNVRVREAFSQLLGRGTSAPDEVSWSLYAQRYGQLMMRASIMSSDEYWNRANVRF